MVGRESGAMAHMYPTDLLGGRVEEERDSAPAPRRSRAAAYASRDSSGNEVCAPQLHSSYFLHSLSRGGCYTVVALRHTPSIAARLL